jgi:WXG100 family type VII secretion target
MAAVRAAPHREIETANLTSVRYETMVVEMSASSLDRFPERRRKRGESEVSNQTASEAAVMEQTAAKFESANQSLNQMLNSLMSELEVLQSAWKGSGAQSFEQVKIQWSEDQRKVSHALAETATAIRTAGRQYTSSDSEASGRLGSVSTGINLPL